MSFTPQFIANLILDEADRQGQEISLMQLLALAYIAHGWTLALLKLPLINAEPEAWQHGPVFPPIYCGLRRQGASPIKTRIWDAPSLNSSTKPNSDQLEIIRSVVKHYGEKHALSLGRITRKFLSPWRETFNCGPGKNIKIPDRLTFNYFTKLAS